MSHATLEAPAALPKADDEAPRDDAVQARLRHLFRHSLRAGTINPLLHVVLRHRLETLS